MESPEAKPQPSVDTPTQEEDTRPKVLIRGRCRMATQQMHLASWSVTSFSSMTCASS